MKETDIGGMFQRNQRQRPGLTNSESTITFPPDGSRLKSWLADKSVTQDVRAQNFPRTDFV